MAETLQSIIPVCGAQTKRKLGKDMPALLADVKAKRRVGTSLSLLTTLRTVENDASFLPYQPSSRSLQTCIQVLSSTTKMKIRNQSHSDVEDFHP